MSDPIRVLHVIGIMNRGGAETMIMNLYRNIDREKVQFDFVENSSEPAAFDDEIRSLGGRIYRCPHYNGKNHVAYTKWWHSFFRGHKGEHPIVHGHLGSTAAIYLSIAKKYGAYTIAHSHSAGAGSAAYRLMSYPTRHIADHFFACSVDAGIFRYGRKVGTDPRRCRVLNNAIELEKFVYNPDTAAKIRKQLVVGADVRVIGHVGRFVEAKNHSFLLAVFAELRRLEPKAVLLLVGDGELRSQIEEKIADLGLRDAVILTGVQSNTWDYYQAMDVFVMPSHYEGLPVSLVEAQTAGLPCCVSTAVPRESAITELVGFRSLEDSPECWAQWVMECAATPRKEMTETIRSAGYDISETARWLQNYYTKVVNSRG